MPSSNVLLLDDDPALHQILPEVIRRRLPVTVHTASRPSEALTRLQCEPYEVVVTDYSLPECDGLVFVGRARKVAPAAQMVVVTGVPDPLLAEEAFRLGALDFLAKPFIADELVGALRRGLRVHRLEKRVAAHERIVARLHKHLDRLSRRLAKMPEGGLEGVPEPTANHIVRWANQTVEMLTKTLIQAEVLGRTLDELRQRQRASILLAQQAARERLRARVARVSMPPL